MATEVDGGATPLEPPVDTRTAAAIEDDPQSFILGRELNEVYLLLDNLSADPDTTIEALSARQPPEGLDAKWIDRVCEIRWPPPQSNVQKAEQAALLIRTRDYLNRIARPASGMSIAFTLMVTQKDDVPRLEANERKPGVDVDETLSRSSLAENAYPDLKVRAAIFRRWLVGMRFFLITWLVVTCLLSWDVAFGNSVLAEVAAHRERVVKAQAVVDSLEAGRGRPANAAVGADQAADAQAPAEAAADLGAGDAPAATATATEVGYCERWRLLPPRRVAAENGDDLLRQYESADQLQACTELEKAQVRLNSVAKRPAGWLWPWQWLVDIGKDPGDAASSANHLATLLGTAVLPVFYGLLGAAAAVLRSLSHKIRTSTLTPRDLSLSLQQLALGAVVGACIGLFIVGGDKTLIGPVTLSGSAISFVAGFGVEAVFQALEALISRLFNLAPAGAPRNAQAVT